MPSAGFDSAMPVIKQLHTYVLYLTATEIGFERFRGHKDYLDLPVNSKRNCKINCNARIDFRSCSKCTFIVQNHKDPTYKMFKLSPAE